MQGPLSQPSLSAPATAVQAVLQPLPTQESGPSNASIIQHPSSPKGTLPNRPPSNADTAPSSLDISSDRPLTNADFPPSAGLKTTNSMDKSPPMSSVGTPQPATNDEFSYLINPTSSIKLAPPLDIPEEPNKLMPSQDRLDKSTSSLLDSSHEDFTSSSPIRLLPPSAPDPVVSSSLQPEPWNGSMKDWEIISEDSVKRTEPVLESKVIDQNSLTSQVAESNIRAQYRPPATVQSQVSTCSQQNMYSALMLECVCRT